MNMLAATFVHPNKNVYPPNVHVGHVHIHIQTISSANHKACSICAWLASRVSANRTQFALGARTFCSGGGGGVHVPWSDH